MAGRYFRAGSGHGESIPSGQAGQVAALEAVGLAHGEAVEIPHVRYDGKPPDRKSGG